MSELKDILWGKMKTVLNEALSDEEYRQLQNEYWKKHGPTHPSIRYSSGNQPDVGTHADHPGVYLVSHSGMTHAFERDGKGWKHIGTAHSVFDDAGKRVYGKIKIQRNKQ